MHGPLGSLTPLSQRPAAEQQRTADFYLDAGLLKQRLDVRNTFERSLEA
jgi:ABC-type nitrate/sulfonate/bicarbonate transport system substrate-binding protein